MSKALDLIKDMKILLESTDMSPLQRQSDVLIGRAIYLLAQPEQDLRKGLREELSLRDHFAGLAMQGLMNVYAQDYSKSVSDKEIADWSYDQADAMLKARGGSDE